MIKKQKLSRYELTILASAYNLKNYCKNTSCSDCIFEKDFTTCVLTTPDNPWDWELWKVKDKEGEAE